MDSSKSSDERTERAKRRSASRSRSDSTTSAAPAGVAAQSSQPAAPQERPNNAFAASRGPRPAVLAVRPGKRSSSRPAPRPGPHRVRGAAAFGRPPRPSGVTTTATTQQDLPLRQPEASAASESAAATQISASPSNTDVVVASCAPASTDVVFGLEPGEALHGFCRTFLLSSLPVSAVSLQNFFVGLRRLALLLPDATQARWSHVIEALGAEPAASFFNFLVDDDMRTTFFNMRSQMFVNVRDSNSAREVQQSVQDVLEYLSALNKMLQPAAEP